MVLWGVEGVVGHARCNKTISPYHHPPRPVGPLNAPSSNPALDAIAPPTSRAATVRIDGDRLTPTARTRDHDLWITDDLPKMEGARGLIAARMLSWQASKSKAIGIAHFKRAGSRSCNLDP
jgi:hypothetical protein